MVNFLLIGICFLLGILLRRFNRIPEETPRVLNSFIIYISLPALAILYIHNVKISFEILIPISAAWFLFGFAAIVFIWLSSKLNWDRSLTGTMILVCGLGNTSFLGLPMIEVFFGKEGIPTGLLIDQMGSFLVLSTLGIFTASYFSGAKFDMKTVLKRIAVFPPFISIIIAFLLLPVDYPKEMISLLEKLGSTLTPLALFSVGFQLRLTHLNKHKMDLAVGLFFKLILAPAVLYLFYFFITHERGLTFDVTIFESAMPPMITAAIVAAEYKLNRELAAMLVGIGILLSFVTLSGWWMILV
ncbi:MAG: AEC family transporter [Ignavibacteriaceae bacterium]|nr:AEC family transporter [Ignavibacteriaceae bacterium]